METIKFKIQKTLAEPTTGHPSRENDQKIKRLEQMVLMLAEQIDNLYINFNPNMK